MSFLLDTSILGDINPMHLLLAAGMILVAFYIYKTKFTNSDKNIEQNEEVADVVSANNENSASLDEEIVAVIAAAIAMAESESNGLKFRVVSFRRI
jgi:Na+-transporting methylmalonyl-CoA/oxaloacetate decarboxylase gamma subunit